MSDFLIPQFPLNKSSYTSIDFLTLREELLAKLPLITNGNYTDIGESDPGIAILETILSGIDNLMFYLGMTNQELDLEKARQRTSVIKLLRLINYELNGVSASRGTVTFYVSPGANPIYPVTVQKGTQVTAQGQDRSITFTTTQTVTLTSASDSKTVPVIQGISYTETFTSDGSPSQKFTLNNTNIDRSTVNIYVDDNITDSVASQQWTQVSSFYDSRFDSQVFKVQTDAQSRVSFIFGDGQFGKIPPRGAQIVSTYIKTDGASGNVGRNAITKVSSGVPLVADSRGSSVSLSVLNSGATAGGTDTETIEHGKEVGLGLLFSLNRAVTRGDLAAWMLSVPGVDKATAWGEAEEEFPQYKLMNRVRACFLSNAFFDMYYNSASRSSYRSLRDNLVRPLLLSKLPVATSLEFVDPIVKDVFVSILVGIDLNKYDPNLVLDSIRFTLTTNYSIDSVNFGQDVRISEILQLVNEVPGVSWARITRLHTTPSSINPDPAPNPPLDIILQKWEIPSFIDVPTQPLQTTPSNIAPVYILIKTPPSGFVGVNNVEVINPDDQTDILENSFSYFPGANLKHIEISYSAATDEPFPTGISGSPLPADYTTFSSIG